jgi:hypothetical protein
VSELKTSDIMGEREKEIIKGLKDIAKSKIERKKARNIERENNSG